MVVYSKEVSYLIYACKKFEERQPNRWQLISRFMQGSASNGEIGNSFKYVVPTDCEDEKLGLYTARQCQTVYKKVKLEYPYVFDKSPEEEETLYSSWCTAKDGLKPFILLPLSANCLLCSARLTAISKPSFPILYTEKGVSLAASYTSECRKCDKNPRYNCSFYTTNEDRNVRFYSQDETNAIFLLSGQTAFEINFLERCTKELDILGASFEGLCEVYNETFEDMNHIRMSAFASTFGRSNVCGKTWRMAEDRLQEAWFLHRIVKLPELRDGISLKYSIEGHHLDIESVCQDVNEVGFRYG